MPVTYAYDAVSFRENGALRSSTLPSVSTFEQVRFILRV